MPLKFYRGMDHTSYINGRNYLLKLNENSRLLNHAAGAGALQPVDGHPTIGYGWDITANSYNATITAFADANIALTLAQKNALQQYKSGNLSADGLINAWSDIDLNDDQATSLLNVAAQKFETAFSNSLGSSNIPESYERAALISEVYNIGGIGGAPTENSLILATEATAKDGYKQHEEIWYEIGFDSDSLNQSASVVHGLEVRRIREADTFALYVNGGTPIDDDEAKSIFKVVGDHGNASGLKSYLTARGYTAAEARSIVDSRLQAAVNYLQQHHLRVGSIDNYDNIQVADDSIGRRVLTGGDGDGLLFADTAGAVLRGGNGNYSIYGGDGGDTLIGGSGINFLDGGDGTDTIVARGQESHVFGGLGDDRYAIGANTWIEDTVGHDTVSYGGITVYGGTKQWWMEGNKAYWAPFSTLLAAFPVIGSEILYTASFFIDVQTMKFATYMLGADGTLQMNLGWGHGGTAAITDYNLNLDTGIGSAGIAVFTAGHGGTSTSDSGSMDRLQRFVNLALKAGFGHGIGGFDPVVLDLDGDGYELTTQGNSRTYFEFDQDGFGERTGWLRGGDDGFLVRDANGNGNIDDVTEMFGNATTSGFAMLGAYDLNADGKIDAADAVFSELRVWQDANGNAVVDAGELKSLAELGIVSISLANSAPAEPTDAAGNAIVHTGHFTRADGTTGDLADVALDIDQTASRWLGDAKISAQAAALPQLTGFGEIKDLRVAMTGDSTLAAIVSSFVQQAGNDLPTLKAAAEAILYEWAGVEGVAATAIGGAMVIDPAIPVKPQDHGRFLAGRKLRLPARVDHPLIIIRVREVGGVFVETENSPPPEGASTAVDVLNRSQGPSPGPRDGQCNWHNLLAQFLAQSGRSLFLRSQQNQQPSGETGWGGRIRTCECRYQKPVPYHLATPQQPGGLIAAVPPGGRPQAFASRRLTRSR
ncbi:MAG: hypothetical protein QOH04_2917 [Sphingomonadales bacterium]|nr:hypothetical protein [Sphingomonadales bacterium]